HISVSNVTTYSTKEIYISCNTNDSFRLYIKGSVIACVWLSSSVSSYTTARNNCNAMSTHLYTIKTLEKLQILQENYVSNGKIWIGLNDIVEEGVYRWEDDDSICDDSCKTMIHAQNEPNNYGNSEDCNVFNCNAAMCQCDRKTTTVCTMLSFKWLNIHIVFFFHILNSHKYLATTMTSVHIQKSERNDLVILNSTLLYATSHLDCARKCLLSSSCYCYYFNIQEKTCDIGKCSINHLNVVPTKDIYIPCEFNKGFQFVTIGGARECLSVSTKKYDYITARDDCRSKSSHLYTIHNITKLTWLQSTFGNTNIWVGLNDIDVENTFRWEDDNSVISGYLKGSIFTPGKLTCYKAYIN
ncbi:C-type lectin domain family 4 member M, partial [Biomphalaria pfeifferi]